MPFLSSASSRSGALWRISNASLPTITINSTTNFNQDRATFNATVNPNGATTSVQFQYKRNVDSTWTNGATISGLTGGSQSVFSNQTGLAHVGTLYNVRAVATNSVGSTTSGTDSFTTWSLKTYASATVGTTTFTISTVTPTGGTAVIPSIYNVFILGGGGGGSVWNGGAGGGYRLVSSRAFTSTANTTLTLTVGGGGGLGNPVGGTGGTTQISASNFTSIDAGGGTGGNDNTGYGGNVGYGDNPAYTGGVFTSWSSGGKNPTIYFAGGGGAGIGGYGGNGSASSSGGYGGNGGTGGTAYGYNGGAGGAGLGSTAYGSNGAYHSYGSGGVANSSNGVVGLIYFLYYGP